MSDIRDNLAGTTRQGSAELALRRHGVTSRELLKLAHAAASAGIERMKPPPPLDQHEREDLVAALLEYGLRWAIVYDVNQDPRRNFATSVYSRMRLRVIDWCRTNIHDPRFGTDKRHLAIDTSQWSKGSLAEEPSRWEHQGDDPDHVVERRDPSSVPTVPWSDTTRDAFVEPDFQDLSASRMDIERYERAAAVSGLSVGAWVKRSLDIAAELELEAA